MLDHTPITYRGAAADGNLYWLTTDTNTTLSCGSEYTGKWIGFKAGDMSDAVLQYTNVAAAEAAGCHIGDWPEKLDSDNNIYGGASAKGPKGGVLSAVAIGGAFARF